MKACKELIKSSELVSKTTFCLRFDYAQSDKTFVIHDILNEVDEVIDYKSTFVAASLLKFIIALLSIFPLFISSQNLISNGGFDSLSKCPNRISQIKLATGWLNSGSPDLFCTCAQPKSAVYAYLSFVGSLLPHSGNCYSGFIVNTRYKEYLVYELPQKMRKRTTYCIRFLYARSEFSGIKVDSLGVYLHKKMHKNAVMGQPMHEQTAAAQIADHPGAWTSVSFTFTCKGGERFITLGSFGNDLTKAEHLPSKKNRKNIRVFNYSRSAYYFIEDVELIRLRDGETCLPSILPVDTVVSSTEIIAQRAEQVDSVIPTKPFVLQELNFETAKSEILATSFEELDELADHLISQPELNLLVVGHTDNTGNEKMNKQLSEDRAKAVADYLISKGVKRERLSSKGFGSKKPIANNATEEGRKLNRRVELRFN